MTQQEFISAIDSEFEKVTAALDALLDLNECAFLPTDSLRPAINKVRDIRSSAKYNILVHLLEKDGFVRQDLNVVEVPKNVSAAFVKLYAPETACDEGLGSHEMYWLTDDDAFYFTCSSAAYSDKIPVNDMDWHEHNCIDLD